MAYFPEYYGGELWGRALSQVGADLGNSIAASIQYYRERHEKLAEMDKTFEALTQIPDVNGKPVLDPKAYERVRHLTDKERYATEQGYMQALQIGTQLQQAHANINKAILSERYSGGDLLYDQYGNPYAQRNPRTGTYSKFPQPPTPKLEGSVQALTTRTNKSLANLGITTDDFLSRDEEKVGAATVDPQTQKFNLKSFEQRTPEETGKTGAVQFKVGGKTYLMPKDEFDTLVKMHPRKGDPGYDEHVKVGQPQPRSAIDYPIGTKARFGKVWKIMTDHGWVPGTPPNNVANQQGTVSVGDIEDDDADNQ